MENAIMNLKTKVVGFAAGAALSIGLATGVMAAPGDTTVTLANGAPCAASISAGEINFGAWTWDGDSYANSTAASGSVTVAATNAVFGVTACNVTLVINDLSSASGSIPAADLTLSGTTPGTYTVPQQQSVDVTAVLTTDLTTLAPDTYTGTITVGTVNAAP
jgi:hypothetical protein